MSFYQRLADFGQRIIPKHVLLKYAFNWSPMYSRTTASITDVAKDLSTIKLKLPLSYRNSNYVGSIFGGSMFAATDPIPMVQLIQLLGKDYVVWDKSAQIVFRKPARETLICQSTLSEKDLNEIGQAVAKQQEIDYTKVLELTDENEQSVFCHIEKVVYIADKKFYQEKKKAREEQALKDG